MRAKILVTTTVTLLLATVAAPAQAQRDPDGAAPWATVAVPPDPSGRDFRWRYLFGGTLFANGDGWLFGVQVMGGRGAFEAFALRRDGLDWRPAPLVPGLVGDLRATSATSPDNVWVAVYRGGCTTPGPALHFDGASWTVPPTGSSFCPSFWSIKAFAPDDVWAVGETNDLSGAITSPGIAARFDGRQWNQVSLADRGAPIYLTAVGGVASDDVWLMGTRGLNRGGELVALHWDGAKLEAVPTRLGGDFFHIHKVLALASGDVWAVGASAGGSVVMHWDGSTWSAHLISGGSLSDIAANGGVLMAVGRTTGEGGGGEGPPPPFAVRRMGDRWWPVSRLGAGTFLEGIAAVPGTPGFLVSGGSESRPGTDALTPFLASYDPDRDDLTPKPGTAEPPPIPPPPVPPPSPPSSPSPSPSSSSSGVQRPQSQASGGVSSAAVTRAGGCAVSRADGGTSPGASVLAVVALGLILGRRRRLPRR